MVYGILLMGLAYMVDFWNINLLYGVNEKARATAYSNSKYLLLYAVALNSICRGGGIWIELFGGGFGEGGEVF